LSNSARHPEVAAAGRPRRVTHRLSSFEARGYAARTSGWRLSFARCDRIRVIVIRHSATPRKRGRRGAPETAGPHGAVPKERHSRPSARCRKSSGAPRAVFIGLLRLNPGGRTATGYEPAHALSTAGGPPRSFAADAWQRAARTAMRGPVPCGRHGGHQTAWAVPWTDALRPSTKPPLPVRTWERCACAPWWIETAWM